MNFCDPEIPGLGHRQSWDSGLEKTAGIPWLQSLILTVFGYSYWSRCKCCCNFYFSVWSVMYV